MAAGDFFPSDIKFSYIPESTCDGVTCGKPVEYDASKEFANKRIVLVSVPGAFTATCSEKHLPGYIKNQEKFKSLGVENIFVMAFNDAFVMRAWKENKGIKGDYIEFVCDPGTAFAKQLGWTKGERTGRFAMLIDHGKILYAEKEPGSEVTVSSADEVLKYLEQM